MSVYSMTGYASLQIQAPRANQATDHSQAQDLSSPAWNLGLELRSVNSRFLDLSFKLSDELRSLEVPLRELLTQSIKRGKVELRAYLNRAGNVAESLSIPSSSFLDQLDAAQQMIITRLPQARALSVADVLRISAISSDSVSAQELAEPLLNLTKQALVEFHASREREGARLGAMLSQRVAQLRALVRSAQPLVPQLVAQQQQRFLERFEEALQLAQSAGQSANIGSAAAQERALVEAAAFAMRIDVAEELTRLLAHLDEIDALLSGKSRQSGELGKRLDFIIQELHREANTLGSKSATLELSRMGVEMKVLIEQMREQVQNIE